MQVKGETPGKLHLQLYPKGHMPQLNCEAILVQNVVLAFSIFGKHGVQF